MPVYDFVNTHLINYDTTVACDKYAHMILTLSKILKMIAGKKFENKYKIGSSLLITVTYIRDTTSVASS